MDNGKHRSVRPDLLPHLLPHEGANPYPRLVAADETDMRRIRVPKALWEAYAEIVGDGGRASDLREYMEWRVEHPGDPLPGRWRGPVKRTRGRKNTPAD